MFSQAIQQANANTTLAGLFEFGRGLAQMASAGRNRRMSVLLSAVVLLSAFDLVMTLRQMQTHGMAEGNPLVVHLVRYTGSATSVGAYKMLTVIVSVSLLFRLRRHLQAELAAWCAVLILSGLTVQWIRYNTYLNGLESTTVEQLHRFDSEWTKIEAS